MRTPARTNLFHIPETPIVEPPESSELDPVEPADDVPVEDDGPVLEDGEPVLEEATSAPVEEEPEPVESKIVRLETEIVLLRDEAATKEQFATDEIARLVAKVEALQSDVFSWQTGHDSQVEHRRIAEDKLAALQNCPLWEIHWKAARVWVAAQTIEIAVEKAKKAHPGEGDPVQVRQGGVKIIF